MALDGGITNRNFRMRLGGRDVVVRLPGKDTELLGIDRAAEREATRGGGARGRRARRSSRSSPTPPCLVTGVHRRAAGSTAAELREPAHARRASPPRCARSTRAAPLPVALRRVRDRRRLPARRRAAGGARCRRASTSWPPARARSAHALTGPEHAPVACHNDLLTANFLYDGARVRIVDWEYAGMGDRYFDLGNLSVNNGFAEADDERLLAAYWREPCTPRRFAALRLMRIMSDFREGMWGVVQSAISALDFDFAAYADEHLTRVAAGLADPRFPTWLEDARGDQS